MPRERNEPMRDAAWLLDMLTAARAVRAFVEGRTFEQYEQDLLFRSAVERQVEIIGEAARGISNAFQGAHPEIPWRLPIAMRNRLVHAYFDINLDILWQTADAELPALVKILEPLLKGGKET